LEVPGLRINLSDRPNKCICGAAAIILKFPVITLSQVEVKEATGLNGF